MNKFAIAYHNDVMGHSCVNVARLISNQVRFIPSGFNYINYGDLPKERCNLFVVGLFLDESDYIKLAKAYNLSVYTNSDTEINKINNIIKKGYTINGSRDTSKGPMLSMWEDAFPDKPAPTVIKYLSDYHTWTFEYPDSEAFKYGLSLYSTKPGKRTIPLWNDLLSNKQEVLRACIQNGKDIMKYHNLLFQEYQDELAYGTKLGKIQALACNTRYNSKILADHRNEEYYPIFLNYEWNASMGKYQVSVYSNNEKYHAGNIAREYGGGGSQGVGAFKCIKLPFEEKKIKHDNPIDGEDNTPFMDTHVNSKSHYKKFAVAKFAHRQNQTDTLMRAYTTQLGEYSIKACNTPYNEIDAFYNVELTGEQLAVTYVWTNFGKYRIVIMPILSNVDLKKICEQYGGKIHKNKIYMYTHTLPFEQ